MDCRGPVAMDDNIKRCKLYKKIAVQSLQLLPVKTAKAILLQYKRGFIIASYLTYFS